MMFVALTMERRGRRPLQIVAANFIVTIGRMISAPTIGFTSFHS